MSGIEITRIAWDSCVFLAWFQGEEDKPLGDIEELLKDIADARITLVVSAIVGAEVLDRAGQNPVRTQFREFIRRTNVIGANADFRVAEIAADIREKAVSAQARGLILKGVKAPDALIVATALVYRVDVLHTFDPVLLGLNGSTIVDGLRITEPMADQGRMF
jgi:predicted nucleic acid-binding protein